MYINPFKRKLKLPPPVSCSFCGRKFVGAGSLRRHSATCSEHPAVQELKRAKRGLSIQVGKITTWRRRAWEAREKCGEAAKVISDASAVVEELRRDLANMTAARTQAERRATKSAEAADKALRDLRLKERKIQKALEVLNGTVFGGGLVGGPFPSATPEQMAELDRRVKEGQSEIRFTFGSDTDAKVNPFYGWTDEADEKPALRTGDDGKPEEVRKNKL